MFKGHQMKTCYKCKEIKLKSEFNKSKLLKDGLQLKCKSCDKEYYELNKEKIKKRIRKYHWDNRDIVLLQQKIRAEANKDNKKAYDKIYSKINNKKKQYYRITNIVKIREIKKEYVKNNPNKYASYNHRRRALKANSGGVYLVGDIENLLIIQNNKCVYCRVDLILIGKGRYHVDHRIPLFLLGSNNTENLQLLCPTCNLSKGKTHPDIYEARIGYLR